MKPNPLPSIEILQQRFTYHPDSGELRRANGSLVETKDATGYLVVTFKHEGKKRTLKAHRICWKLHYGTDPLVVDHVNGCRSDNRLSNLRSVDTASNRRNSRRNVRNRSGVAGVSWDTANHCWRAHISDDLGHRRLGSFGTIFDAAAARRSAENSAGYLCR